MVLEKIQFFRFEDDFVEAKIRCIPMIVRFKLDACGIKLKLAEWSRMSPPERERLARLPCETQTQLEQYRNILIEVILNRTGNQATPIPVPATTNWQQMDLIPAPIAEKLKEYPLTVSIKQWQALSELQRFALLKLSCPGHENKNFPKALAEFGLC